MTENVFLLLDQARSICGMLLAIMLFCYRAFPKRMHFYRRLGLGVALCILQAALWIPLYHLLVKDYDRYLFLGFLFVAASGVLTLGVTMFCYEMNLQQALFRGLCGKATEVMTNVVLRYLLIYMLLPGTDTGHPFFYGVLVVSVYFLLYGASYMLVARQMQQGAGSAFSERNGRMLGMFLFSYLGYWLLTAMIQMLLEQVIQPFSEEARYAKIYHTLEYSCIGVLLLISAMVLLITCYVYRTGILEQERRMIQQIERERASQYTFSRENIDLLNRKYHDLKHQLQAMEYMERGECRKLLKETSDEIALYDAKIQTGNEVLDTILTEKSILCISRGIKISYNVNARHLDKIKVTDLYILMGNALDNAIECVSELENQDRRTISVTVKNQGSMIYIATENYFEREIQIKEGFPVTHKKDKENHGFGMKSMEHIAKTYHGSIRITAENQIFRLQILMMPEG